MSQRYDDHPKGCNCNSACRDYQQVMAFPWELLQFVLVVAGILTLAWLLGDC